MSSVVHNFNPESFHTHLMGHFSHPWLRSRSFRSLTPQGGDNTVCRPPSKRDFAMTDKRVFSLLSLQAVVDRSGILYNIRKTPILSLLLLFMLVVPRRSAVEF